MKRVVVTGAAGFVGANLVRRLVSDGHEVHMFIHPVSDRWRLSGLATHARAHPVDLEDSASVDQAMTWARPDWVFHAAAHGAYPDQTDLRRMISTNIVGTVNVVESAMRVGFEALVHTGSSSEYGATDHAPAPDELPEPNSHYAVTKASATLYTRSVARRHGAPIRVLRLYSVYGPWEEPTRLMPRLVVEGLRGDWPPMANPSTVRDFVYADDVVDAFFAAAGAADQEPGAVYNVGTGVQTSLAQVCEVAQEMFALGREPRWGAMAGRSWDTHTWVADPTSTMKALGWEAGQDLRSGMARFADWLRSDPKVQLHYERAGS